MSTRRLTVDAVSLIAAAVLSLSIAIISKAITSQRDAWQWVLHTREVLERLEQVNALTRTAESEQRGYLLTADEAYRSESEAAAARAQAAIALIAQLTADNPVQQSSTQLLEQAAKDRFEWLRQTISNSAPGKPNVEALERGHSLMQVIAQLVTAMENEEQRLLSSREEAVSAARRDLIFWVSTSGIATLLLIGVLRWVSRRDAAAIQFGLAKVSAIYRAAPVGLAYVDRDMRIAELNDALAEIYGMSRSEQLNKLPEEMLPAELASKVRSIYEDVFTSGRAQVGLEIIGATHQSPNDTHDWLASYQPVMEEERVTGIVVSVLDVSPLKRAQRALAEANRTLEQRVEERTQQLRDANADLEAFAHTIAHDLRAPLRNIDGFVSALLEDESTRLTDEGQMYLHRMQMGVRRMDQLISDLLAYSRLGRAELVLEPVSLAAALQSALKDLASTIAQTHAEVRAPDPLPDVCGNRQLVVQVLTNLLSNSMKFVAEDIRPQILIHARRQDSHVNVVIEDNGIGIPAEHRDRVFRVFERLHGQEAFPGTGVGLAIVDRAVAKMRGQVAIESMPTGGTRFVVSLPGRKHGVCS